MKWIFKKFLPIYFPKSMPLFFAVWSSPKEPATTVDYLRALRITIRNSAGPVLVIKQGEI